MLDNELCYLKIQSYNLDALSRLLFHYITYSLQSRKM